MGYVERRYCLLERKKKPTKKKKKKKVVHDSETSEYLYNFWSCKIVNMGW